MKNHRLNTLAKKFNIELTQHHRAIYDAEATGYLLLKIVKRKHKKKELNTMINLTITWGKGNAYKRARPYHCTIFAQNEVGLKNLFKLVSISHMNIFIEYQECQDQFFKNIEKEF